MIDKHFKVLKHNNDPDDAILTLQCLTCSHEFDAVLNILRPKNCVHDLGKSVTISCPSCQNNATLHATVNSSTTAVRIATLEAEARALQEAIDKYVNEYEPLFKVTGGTDYAAGTVPVECSDCSFAFVVGIKTNANCVVIDDTLLVRCPKCGKSVEVTKERALKCVQIFMITMRLSIIENELNSLRRSNDATAI